METGATRGHWGPEKTVDKAWETRKGASFRFHQIQVFVDGKEAKQTLDQDSRFGEQVITNEHGNRRTNGKETVPSYAGSKGT